MRRERLTEKAQDALQAAARAAQESGQQAIEPDHLLLELMRQEGGIARPLLQAAGASIPGLEAALVSRVERLPRVSGAGQAYLSSELARILDQAEKEAEQLKDDYVSTEHILLAAAEHPVLAGFGVTRDGLLQALREVRGSQRVTDPNPESK
jgi:ATP-dependent Clp protease ATP-binding subunit ClpB